MSLNTAKQRVSLIVIDDVHFETRDKEQEGEFAQKLSQEIKTLRMAGREPVIIAAGDINSGTDGAAWLSTFDCQSIYVAGNHEFYNHDYYEVISDLETMCSETGRYSNVFFLNNKSITLHGIKFIGSTLWANFADNLPWAHTNAVMKNFKVLNDFKKIRANSWYTKENIERLEDEFLNHLQVKKTDLSDVLENRTFNPLIELDLHHVAKDFLRKELNQEKEGQVVVVTHHVPLASIWLKYNNVEHDIRSGEFINKVENLSGSALVKNELFKYLVIMGHYSSDGEEYFDKQNSPDFWFHGHMHKKVHEVIGNTHVMSCPSGYRKQSLDFSYRIVDMEKKGKYLQSYLQNDFEHSPVFNELQDNLNNIEIIMKKVRASLLSGYIVKDDIQSILDSFIYKHEGLVKDIEKKLVNYLYAIYLQKNKGVFSNDVGFLLKDLYWLRERTISDKNELQPLSFNDIDKVIKNMTQSKSFYQQKAIFNEEEFFNEITKRVHLARQNFFLVKQMLTQNINTL